MTALRLGLAVALLTGIAVAGMPAPMLPEVDAAETAGNSLSTVIAVKGNAMKGPAQKGPWEKITPGEQLPRGTWVKTGRGGAVRLVLPNGSIIRISGRMRQVGAPAGTAPAPASRRGRGGGFFSVLREMFGSAKHSRRAAAESVQGGGGVRFTPNPEQDRAWNALMARPRFTAGEMSAVLEAAADYRARSYQNRALALISRLAADIPEHPALSGLAQNARRAFGAPAQLTLSRLESGSLAAMTPGATLFPDDKVRVEYSSETESFPHIYLRTVPRSGAPSTAVLYSGATAVSPGVRISLPSAATFYELDNVEGREYLWAWVCVAPVHDRAGLESAAEKIADYIQLHGELSASVVSAAAPPLCPLGFALTYGHE